MSNYYTVKLLNYCTIKLFQILYHSVVSNYAAQGKCWYGKLISWYGFTDKGEQPNTYKKNKRKDTDWTHSLEPPKAHPTGVFVIVV